MVRSAVVFAVAVAGTSSGCDLAFSLDRPVLQTVCGSFGDVAEVAFGDELVDITDLSYNADGSRGFVHATVETASGPRTGPVPIIQTDGVWSYDADREANWAILGDNDRVYLARMARDNELWAAQQLTTPTTAFHVFHYGYVNERWVQIESSEIAFTSNSDAFPGGELNIPVPGANPPVTGDFLPVFRFDKLTQVRTVGIALRAPNATVWEDQERIGGVASTEPINEQHQPWSGALALSPATPDNPQRQVLIYAATPDGSAEGSDLFISEKRSGGFTQGIPLTGFNTEDEELEPWVSEDCSMITFRRTPRGSPFVGESRSGGTIYMSTIE